MEYKGLHVERQVVKYKELVGVSVAKLGGAPSRSEPEVT